ncbi:MAG: hypothetical protein ACKO9I_13715 [Sphaerospermopsis kisseleviana]
MQGIENNPLFTQLSAEESVNVNGGDALAGAYTLAAFFIANGGSFLTPEQAIIVIAVTLTQGTSSFNFSSSFSENPSPNISPNLSSTLESS